MALIHRRLAVAALVGPLFAGSPLCAQSPRQYRKQVAQALTTQGYGDAFAAAPELGRTLWSRGGSAGPASREDAEVSYEAKRRSCSPKEQDSLPGCLRFDVMEVFVTKDSSGHGLTPLTFLGRAEWSLLEIEPSAEAKADAAWAARATHSQVFTPSLRMPLPSMPDSALIKAAAGNH